MDLQRREERSRDHAASRHSRREGAPDPCFFSRLGLASDGDTGLGGRHHPSEAALETHLTVEEAEEILPRLVDRGHPVVESQDGYRSYRASQPPSTGRVTPCT